MNRGSRSVAIASLMAAFLSSTSALAQSSAPDAGAPAPSPEADANAAPQTPKGLGEIVVTARRRAEALQNVPVSVAVVSAATLETRNIKTEADLPLAVPGLVVRSSNNSNQLNYVIRGESVDAYSGSPPGVQPYIDDVPFPLLQASAFYDLDSVQAVKGPQGTLFGRNSTGGAVLFQTKLPQADFGGYASVQYGNHNRLITEAAINAPIAGDVLRVRLAGTVTSGGAYVRNLYDNSRLGDKNEHSGRITVDFRPASNFSNVLVAQLTRAHGTNVPNTMYYAIPCGQPSGFNSCTYSPDNQPFFGNLLGGSSVPGYPNGYVYPGGFANLPAFQKSQGKYVVDQNSLFDYHSRSDLVIDRATLNLNSNVTLKNIFGYSFSKSALHYDEDYSPYPILQQYAPSLLLTGAKLPLETSATKTFSNELQLQVDSSDRRLSFLLGGFFIQANENYLSPLWLSASNFSTAYNALTKNRSFAVFSQATYKLTDKLSLTLGGRYTWENIKMRQLEQSLFGVGQPQHVNQSDPSWTLSADYHLTPSLMAYVATRGSWRRGGFNPFNPPTATPMTAADAAGGNFFKPERVRDVEGGLKFAGRVGGVPVRANIAVYNSWVQDIQKTAYVVIAGTASSATINVPRTKITGVEADFSVHATDWLDVGAAGAYTDARFTKAQSRLFGNIVTYGPFGDVPKVSGTVYADAKLPLSDDLGSLNYHIDAYYQSSFYFSNLGGTIQPGTRLPRYALLNMRLDWANMFGSKIKAGVFVKNLTDKLYYSGGSAGAQNFSEESASFGQPRTFGVELRADF